MTKRVLAAAVAVVLAGAAADAAKAATAANGFIAYECTTEDFDRDICTLDPISGEVRNLTNDTAPDGLPSWSPDGSHIAFYSGYGIDIMKADGTERRHLVGGYGEYAFSPAWSPDGTRIAFVSTRGETDYELWTVPASGESAETPAVRLTTTPLDSWGRGIDDYQPTWSPDSARIAFVSQSRVLLDACDIWVMDSLDRDGDGNGDNLARLTRDDSYNCDALEDTNPVWSPTDDLIAYSGIRTEWGTADIFVMKADGTERRNVTNHEVWDHMPGWSPDGKNITFTSGRDGDDEIYSLALADVPPAIAPGTRARMAAGARAAATPVEQLTHNDTPDRSAEWGVSTVNRPPVTTITAPAPKSLLSPAWRYAVRGTVADDRGVRSVQVALRRRLADGSCSHWNGTSFVATGCSGRIWLPVTGTTRWQWTMPRLEESPGRLGGYTAFARAKDTGGRTETRLASGRNVVSFKVGR